MALIFAESATKLSTVGGFFRTLAANIGPFSATELSLSSTRTIAFTPAFAEPMRGIVLALSAQNVTSNMKSVVVTLKESGTIRATQTLTAAQILNSTANAFGVWIVYFNGGTFPYSVTTSPGVWTVEVSSTGAESTHWSLRTSDGTNPFFHAIGNTAVSFSPGNDAIGCGARVTADMSTTLKGVAITGDATRSVCGYMCRATSPTPDNVSMFETEFNTGAYNVLFDGHFVESAHSGVRIGTHVLTTSSIAIGATSATLASNWPHATGTYSVLFSSGEFKRVTFTNSSTSCTWSGALTKAHSNILSVGQPTANACSMKGIRASIGTATNSGLSSVYASNTTNRTSRASIQFMGEVPSVEDDTLANDVLKQGNVTITIASPAVVSYTAHNVLDGTPIKLSTTGALPTGLTAGTTYYVKSPTTNAFNLSATPGGAAINTSGSQSGTHTVVPVIITTNSTGWASGDRVFVGGQDVKGNGDRNVYTVSSTSGQEIILTASLTTNTRKSCSGRNHIIRFNGYGAQFLGDSTSTGIGIQDVGTLSNLTIFGCQCQYVGIRTNSNGGNSSEDAAYRSKYLMFNSSMEGLPAGVISQFLAGQSTEEDMLLDNVNAAFLTIVVGTNGGSCSLSVSYNQCIWLTPGPVNSTTNTMTRFSARFTYCSFENGNNSFTSLSGSGPGFDYCHFWGCSGSLGSACRYGTCQGVRSSYNSYQNMSNTINYLTSVTGIEFGSDFGTIVANTVDISGTTGMYVDQEYDSCIGNPVIGSGIQETPGVSLVAEGSIVKFNRWNNTDNDNRCYLRNGKYQKTGASLADTTAYNGSGFCHRVSADNPGKTMYWPNRQEERAIPTGNIQYKPMTVGILCSVKNSAFWAGTHVMPTFKIKYDNSTIVSAVHDKSKTLDADGNLYGFVLLSITFVPQTTYPQIEAWTEYSTDATGSNTYVYWKNLKPGYPAGTIIDTTSLDLSAHGLPVWPPFVSFGQPDTLLDTIVNTHQYPGSLGEYIKLIKLIGDTNTILTSSLRG